MTRTLSAGLTAAQAVRSPKGHRLRHPRPRVDSPPTCPPSHGNNSEAPSGHPNLPLRRLLLRRPQPHLPLPRLRRRRGRAAHHARRHRRRRLAPHPRMDQPNRRDTHRPRHRPLRNQSGPTLLPQRRQRPLPPHLRRRLNMAQPAIRLHRRRCRLRRLRHLRTSTHTHTGWNFAFTTYNVATYAAYFDAGTGNTRKVRRRMARRRHLRQPRQRQPTSIPSSSETPPSRPAASACYASTAPPTTCPRPRHHPSRPTRPEHPRRAKCIDPGPTTPWHPFLMLEGGHTGDYFVGLGSLFDSVRQPP